MAMTSNRRSRNLLITIIFFVLCQVSAGTLVMAWAQQSFADTGHKPLLLAKNDTPADQQLPTAVVWYMEMAKNGDADAQYNLGSVYETGFGVKRDPGEAFRWYKEAAKQDHQLAQLKLGILYVLGEGTRQSIIKGTSWIQSAGDNGNKFAVELYNRVLAPDIVLEMSAADIIKKVKPFIDLGEKKSIAKLTAVLQKEEKKAEKKQPELAQRFTGKAKNTLGKEVEIANRVPDFLEEKNKGVPSMRDSNLALLQREANAGNPEAQFQLGRLYDTGEKLERDRQKAITWYTSAANQGHAEAQYRLAVAYLFGVGITRNPSLGESWLTKSAKQNHPVAKELLPIYKANRVVNKPLSIAVTWYLEKALDEDPDGEFGLGYLYENGWGINPNGAEARKWYTQARAIGSGGAARRLRQIKATKASNDPDPAPESVPKMPEKTPSSASTANNAQRASSNSPVSANLPSDREERSVASTVRDSASSLMATVTKRSALTPVILILFGLVMGITVFKWMRRGNYKKSVF